MRRAVLLLILASCDACPAAARTLTVVYQHSSRPAAGVRATFRDTRSNRSVTRAVGGAGAVAVPFDDATVRVVDPGRNDLLLVETFVGAAESVVRVPEPVRVRGTVAVQPARVRVGWGVPMAPHERVLRDEPGDWLRTSREHEVFGVPVPPSASHWQRAPLQGRSFTSGWATAAAPLQVVVIDGRGGVTIADVPIPPDVRAGQMLQAGALPGGALYGLDVDVDLPKTDVAVSLMLHVEDATFDPARRDEIGRWLSVLDQIEPRLFRLFVFDSPLAIALDGRTRIAGLPPFATLRVSLGDHQGGATVQRDLTVARGAPTPLRLGFFELLAQHDGARGPAEGRVTVPGGATGVAGARIVWSDFPDRRETTTDTDGRFVIADVRRDHPVAILVDAAKRTLPRDAVRTHIFRAVDPSHEIALELPRVQVAARLVRDPGGRCTTVAGQYPALAGAREDGQWRPIQMLAYDTEQKRFHVQVPDAGQWTFFYFETAFVGYFGGTNVTDPSQPFTVYVNTPLTTSTYEHLIVQVYGQDGNRAPGVEAQVGPFIPDLDPISIVSGGRADLDFYCVNNLNVSILIIDPDKGCFYGDVVLGQTERINLRSCAGFHP